MFTQPVCSRSSDGTIVFAVNTYKAWSTPVSDEFDICVDSNGDGSG